MWDFSQPSVSLGDPTWNFDGSKSVAIGYPMEVLGSPQFKALTNPSVTAAVITLCQQLTAAKSHSTVYGCVALLKDMLEDLLMFQANQVPLAVPPAGIELAIQDYATQQAMVAIRTYIGTGIVTGAPPCGNLSAKNVFPALVVRLIEANL